MNKISLCILIASILCLSQARSWVGFKTSNKINYKERGFSWARTWNQFDSSEQKNAEQIIQKFMSAADLSDEDLDSQATLNTYSSDGSGSAFISVSIDDKESDHYSIRVDKDKNGHVAGHGYHRNNHSVSTDIDLSNWESYSQIPVNSQQLIHTDLNGDHWKSLDSEYQKQAREVQDAFMSAGGVSESKVEQFTVYSVNRGDIHETWKAKKDYRSDLFSTSVNAHIDSNGHVSGTMKKQMSSVLDTDLDLSSSSDQLHNAYVDNRRLIDYTRGGVAQKKHLDSLDSYDQQLAAKAMQEFLSHEKVSKFDLTSYPNINRIHSDGSGVTEIEGSFHDQQGDSYSMAVNISGDSHHLHGHALHRTNVHVSRDNTLSDSSSSDQLPGFSTEISKQFQHSISIGSDSSDSSDDSDSDFFNTENSIKTSHGTHHWDSLDTTHKAKAKAVQKKFFSNFNISTSNISQITVQSVSGEHIHETWKKSMRHAIFESELEANLTTNGHMTGFLNKDDSITISTDLASSEQTFLG